MCLTDVLCCDELKVETGRRQWGGKVGGTDAGTVRAALSTETENITFSLTSCMESQPVSPLSLPSDSRQYSDN